MGVASTTRSEAAAHSTSTTTATMTTCGLTCPRWMCAGSQGGLWWGRCWRSRSTRHRSTSPRRSAPPPLMTRSGPAAVAQAPTLPQMPTSGRTTPATSSTPCSGALYSRPFPSSSPLIILLDSLLLLLLLLANQLLRFLEINPKV
jgi:hypothetical protein